LVFVVFGGGEEGSTASTVGPVSAAATTLAAGQGDTTQTTAAAPSTTLATDPPASTTSISQVDTDGPERVVLKLFEVMENQDFPGLLDIFDPAVWEALPAGESLEAAKEALKDTAFGFGEMNFSGIELSTEITSPTTATVTVTAGTVTITDTDGETTSEDVKDADEPVAFDLVNKDGKWYLASSTFM
jgi:hypothetical protein